MMLNGWIYLKLNENNIPSTHDSRTYNVASFESLYTQTHNLNIKEQLAIRKWN